MKMMHVYFLNKAKGRGLNNLCAWFTGLQGLVFTSQKSVLKPIMSGTTEKSCHL